MCEAQEMAVMVSMANRGIADAGRPGLLDDFGVAMYCGFGRRPGRDGAETMREHAEAVRALLAGAG